MSNYIPKISIIIPIYNVEKYLDRCLDSIQKQSFKDFEVIMVNDASTDNSFMIAKKYADSDSRFILMNPGNIGKADSRNIALNSSRGEYISFVDSDDYVGEDFLAELYKAGKESDADVVVCNYAVNFEPECRIRKMRNLKAGEYEKDEAIRLLLRDKKLRFYIWNKLWKKELIEKTGTQFLEMYYEDIVFCSYNFMEINKLCSIDYVGNFYSRQTKTSFEISMTFDRIRDYVDTVKYVRELLEREGVFEKFRKDFMVHARHVYYSVPFLVIQANHSSDKKVKVFRTIRDYMKETAYYMGNKFKNNKEVISGELGDYAEKQ